MNWKASASTVQVKFISLIIYALLGAGFAHADVVVTEGTNISIDVASDGRIAMDLLGGLWIVSPEHNETLAINGSTQLVKQPRWSPDDNMLVYQSATADKQSVWLYDMATRTASPLTDRHYSSQDPDWHPDGERVIYSSARGDTGFDLWETDLPTGLAWRLTGLPGQETEPAWSADGRNLVYIHQHQGRWSLMLRLQGRADEALVVSDDPLAAPSWRPDGSLVTYLQRDADGWAVWMTILSEPRLHRTLIVNEDFFLSPVAWLDRQQMFYAADGHIRTRQFDSWRSISIPFVARVREAGSAVDAVTRKRSLPLIDPPSGRTIIRAGRVFDGTGASYVEKPDIIIDGGRITGIETQRPRNDGIVVDLGDLTIFPGLIDAYAALPDSENAAIGPLILGLGVTTMVTDHPDATALNATWSGKSIPGPRLLAARPVAAAEKTQTMPWLVTVSGDMKTGLQQKNAVLKWRKQGVPVLADNWQLAMASGANLLLGTDSGPASPAGLRYADVRLASGTAAITMVSGLADAGTPGVADIWRSRIAELIGRRNATVQRYSFSPDLRTAAASLVAGSRSNGLPPGVALHAELRALANAGLSPQQAIKAAGVNAAAALGLGLDIGRIAPGAVADMLVVDGDPLTTVNDLLNIVGIVRNGRFYSVSGLVDRAAAVKTVE